MLACVAAVCLTACHSSAIPDVTTSIGCEEAPLLGCDTSIARLVREANEIGELDAAGLREAQQGAAARFSDKASLTNRIRLALLLMHPNAEPGEGRRGVELLEDALAKDEAAPRSEKAFASFIDQFIARRVDQVDREVEAWRQLNAELKSQQRQLQGQLGDARSALTDERRRRMALEQQLEALKELEETINQRESSDEKGAP